LVRAPIHNLLRGANDAPKIQEGLLIDLIAMEQVSVVAKVSKKSMQLPQGPLSAIQPAEERPVLGGLRLQNDKSEFHEWLLGMPSIRRTVHTNQKHAIKVGFGIWVLRVQPWNLTSHGLTSATGCA